MIPSAPVQAHGSCVFIHRGHRVTDTVSRAFDCGGPTLVVNFGPDLFASARFHAGLRVEPYDRYVTTEDLQAIIAESYVLAPAWCRGLPDTLCTYRGISLADAAAFDFVTLFVEAMKSVCLAERIIDIERPSRVMLVRDGSPAFRAFEAVCRARGVELIALESSEPLAKSKSPRDQTLKWWRVALAVGAVRLGRLVASGRDSAESARVILIPYFRFDPLIKGLASDPRLALLMFGGSVRAGLRDLRRAGRVSTLLPTGYLRISQVVSVARYGRALRRLLPSIDGALDGGPAYHGYHLRGLCRDLVDEHLQSRFLAYAAFVETAHAVVGAERPTHVVVNQDKQGYHRILCIVANQLGVRTVVYQHGVPFNGPELDHVASSVAVWGRHELETYRRLRRPAADRLHILGDPALASLRGRRFEREVIARSLGLDPARPIVLMACERFVNCVSAHERETGASDALAQVCAAAAEEPHVQFLVRWKPGKFYGDFGDSVAIKNEIMDRYHRDNIVMDPGGDLYDRLFVADAVVVRASTVGLDAMIFGKPVIIFAGDGVAGLIDYVSSGAAVRVESREEFRHALARSLHDGAFRASMLHAQSRFLQANFANLNDADPLSRFRDFLLHGVAQPHPVPEPQLAM